LDKKNLVIQQRFLSWATKMLDFRNQREEDNFNNNSHNNHWPLLLIQQEFHFQTRFPKHPAYRYS